MKNAVFQKLFIIYFVLLCIIPVGTMYFFSSDLSENRELSGFPVLVTEDGFNMDFFDECATYVAEHFAFRSQLVALDSEIKYKLFHSPSDSQVILGKEDWMFFEGSLKDYAGVTMSSEEIDALADKLGDVCAYYEGLGKETIFMLVPNKNTIYPEYMPESFGEPATVTNRTMLQNALEKRKVPCLDVAGILLAGKETDELYLHQDTHWNNTGARLVLNALYEKLGVDFAYSLEDYTVEISHESDLSQILFPTRENLEAQRIYPQLHEFSYQKRVRSMDDLNIASTTEEGVGKSIYLYRDSFGRAMIPYMAEVFDEAYFNRSTPYDLSYAAETDCDYVVIEIVERNIPDLCEITIPQK